MAAIAKKITDLIGYTPLLELTNYENNHQLKARILAKLESFNPAGSVKDRIAKAMLETARSQGKLREGAVVIEPTSGNTGIGLAAAAASLGYRLILTMPDTMSQERRKLLKAYGAELVLTEGSLGMKGAIEKAKQLSEEIPGSFIPSQFDNPANPAIHKAATGVEIWVDADGQVDLFVAGVGTGGTISGVGEYLKSKNPQVKIIAVEPFQSQVISGGSHHPHKLQGIGAGFIPQNLNRDIYDKVIAVKDEDAFATCKELARKEGLLAGASSGAAVWAAAQLALRPENENKTIVVLLPDGGDRYLSSTLFED